MWRFQSLLSQGISLLYLIYAQPVSEVAQSFQSLLSQGISLLRMQWRIDRPPRHWRFNPFLVRASVYCETYAPAVDASRLILFQSLLSQGISLLLENHGGRKDNIRNRFNPFLVRASVYCTLIWPLAATCTTGFNPFLVRASVYWYILLLQSLLQCPLVSIPS